MGTLLLVTVLAATMTPEEEVEAWDPTAEAQAAARPTPKTAADERDTQVWKAEGIVNIGTVVRGATTWFGLPAVGGRLEGWGLGR